MRLLCASLCLIAVAGAGISVMPSQATAQGTKVCLNCAYPQQTCIAVYGPGYLACTNLNPGCDFGSKDLCAPDPTFLVGRTDVAPDGSMRGISNRLAYAVASTASSRRPGDVFINVRTTGTSSRGYVRTCGDVVVKRIYSSAVASRLRADSKTLAL